MGKDGNTKEGRSVEKDETPKAEASRGHEHRRPSVGPSLVLRSDVRGGRRGLGFARERDD
jgi:hypothetical protein